MAISAGPTGPFVLSLSKDRLRVFSLIEIGNPRIEYGVAMTKWVSLKIRVAVGASNAGYNGLVMSSTPPPFDTQQVADAIRAGLNGRADPEASPGKLEELSATYRGNLDHYREHVQKSLAEGDYLQAAEKSWGAYAQAIKIIGADHGLHIASHRSILRVADRLTALVGQQDEVATQTLIAGLGLARSLHTHFYENDLPDTTVTASVDRVFSTIDLLQQLFQGNGIGGGGHGDADT